MKWIKEAIEKILNSDKNWKHPFRKNEKELRMDLKEEEQLRQKESKNIEKLQNDTKKELTDLKVSIDELDTGLKLVNKKKEELNKWKNTDKDDILSQSSATYIQNIIEINSKLLEKLDDVFERLKKDYDIDKEEKTIIDELKEENVNEIEIEKNEQKVFDELNKPYEKELTESRQNIDQEELDQEKRLGADVKLNEKFINQILNEGILDPYKGKISKQNENLKLCKEKGDSKNIISSLEPEIEEEISLFRKLDDIESNRKIIIETEMEHETEISEEETVTKALEKKTTIEEQSDNKLKKDISKEKYIKFS